MIARSTFLAAMIYIAPTAAALAQLPKLTDLADTAKELAPKVSRAVEQKQGSKTFRVAVFPFGNSQGRATLDMYEAITILQGELIYNLIDGSEGRFFVLDKAALASAFQDAGVDPRGVSTANPRRTAEVLKKIDVDAAVVGSFGVKDRSEPFKGIIRERGEGPADVRMVGTLVFQDGTFRQLSGAVSPGNLDVFAGMNRKSGRFKVELLMDGRPLPLYRHRDEHSEEARNMYLILPRSARGKEYQIRLTNTGQGTPGHMNPNVDWERLRLFGAAVTIDGVNSIYQDTGGGKIGPVSVHPKNARKWILCGRGVRMVPDQQARYGYRFTRASGEGGAQITLRGFQESDKTARAFTFATAGESVAQTLGISNEIGSISVYFFSQSIRDDRATVAYSAAGSGTTAGRRVPSGTFRVSVAYHRNPVEAWRIIYRYQGDPLPLSQNDLVRVQ